MFNSEIAAKQIGDVCFFETTQYSIKVEKVYYQGKKLEESSISFFTNEVDYQVEAKFHCLIGIDYTKINIWVANELMKIKYQPAIEVIAILSKANNEIVITVGEEVKE